jgi:hypothetical protein
MAQDYQNFSQDAQQECVNPDKYFGVDWLVLSEKVQIVHLTTRPRAEDGQPAVVLARQCTETQSGIPIDKRGEIAPPVKRDHYQHSAEHFAEDGGQTEPASRNHPISKPHQELRRSRPNKAPLDNSAPEKIST